MDAEIAESLWRRHNSGYLKPEDWVFASPAKDAKQPYWPGTLYRAHLAPAAKAAGHLRQDWMAYLPAHFRHAAQGERREDLIPSMTNDPKDRRVLAAARASANAIVTYNHKDFPHSSLTQHSIRAQGPSTFLQTLYGTAPAMVTQTLEDQAAAIGQPLQYLLSRLRINVPAFVATID